MVMLGDVRRVNCVCPEIGSSCNTDGTEGSDGLLFCFLLEACDAPVSFDGCDVSCRLSSASGCFKVLGGGCSWMLGDGGSEWRTEDVG